MQGGCRQDQLRAVSASSRTCRCWLMWQVTSSEAGRWLLRCNAAALPAQLLLLGGRATGGEGSDTNVQWFTGPDSAAISATSLPLAASHSLHSPSPARREGGIEGVCGFMSTQPLSRLRKWQVCLEEVIWGQLHRNTNHSECNRQLQQLHASRPT